MSKPMSKKSKNVTSLKIFVYVLVVIAVMVVVFYVTDFDFQFKNGRPVTIFKDMSQEFNIDKKITSMRGTYGVLWADLNGDDYIDLVFANHGLKPSIYINHDGNRFTDHFQNSGISYEPTYPESLDRHGVACGDYNNDGNFDLYWTRGAMLGETLGIKYDELHKNKGNADFNEVSHLAGTLNSYGRVRMAIWGDYNNNGWLDLFVGNFDSPNVLYANNGDGTFTDVTEQVGLRMEGRDGIRATWVDYNQDGKLDILIGHPLMLFENTGNGFRNVTKEVGLDSRDPGATTGIAWGDYNNNGKLDLFIASAGPLFGVKEACNVLYENTNGKFRKIDMDFGPDIGENAWGAYWVDIDNDGNLDLFIAETNGIRFYENKNGELIRGDLGLNVKPEQRSDLAFGDYNNDGFLDLAIATEDRWFLFENQLATNGNNWIKLIFNGTISNKQGLGSKIFVREQGKLLAFREYRGGSADGTLFVQDCTPLLIGVGKSQLVSIDIYWPSGIKERFEGLEVNQAVELKEDTGERI